MLIEAKKYEGFNIFIDTEILWCPFRVEEKSFKTLAEAEEYIHKINKKEEREIFKNGQEFFYHSFRKCSPTSFEDDCVWVKYIENTHFKRGKEKITNLAPINEKTTALQKEYLELEAQRKVIQERMNVLNMELLEQRLKNREELLKILGGKNE